MLVSAISMYDNSAVFTNFNYYNAQKEQPADAAFYSFTSSLGNKNTAKLNINQLFENIDSWQMYCHRQILDGKLNVIA